MIICMNYSYDGTRYIAYIQYSYDWGEEKISSYADFLSDQYEEVYVIPFIPNEDLINEVVLKGCRI